VHRLEAGAEERAREQRSGVVRRGGLNGNKCFVLLAGVGYKEVQVARSRSLITIFPLP
jgi:hypothetical protein